MDYKLTGGFYVKTILIILALVMLILCLEMQGNVFSVDYYGKGFN